MKLFKFLVLTLILAATTTHISLDAMKRKGEGKKQADNSEKQPSKRARTLPDVEEHKAEEAKEDKAFVRLTSREKKEEECFSFDVPLNFFKHFGLFNLLISFDQETLKEEIAQKQIASKINLSLPALKAFIEMLAFVTSKELLKQPLRKTAIQLASHISHSELASYDLYNIIMTANQLEDRVLLTACLIYLAKNPQRALKENPYLTLEEFFTTLGDLLPEELQTFIVSALKNNHKLTLVELLPEDLQVFIAHEQDLSKLPDNLISEHCFESAESHINDFTQNITHQGFDFAEEYILLPQSFRPMVLKALTQKAHDFVYDEKLSAGELKAAFKELPENWYKTKVRSLYRKKNGTNIDQVYGAIMDYIMNIKADSINLQDWNSSSLPFKVIIEILIILNESKPIKWLNLSSCSLHGSIPARIDQLNYLEMLYLGGNNLDGKIPESIGRLERLTELDLSHNQLSGKIPESFGKLVNLRVLNLSSWRYQGDHLQQLSGKIPESLVNLIHLHLSEDQLGKIIIPKSIFLRINQAVDKDRIVYDDCDCRTSNSSLLNFLDSSSSSSN